MTARQRDPLYEALGRQVRSAREQARLTQEELAQRLGLTRTSVTNIEQGRQKIQVHTLYAIADAFGINVEMLLPRRAVSAELEVRLYEHDLDPAEREWVKRVLAP